MVSSELIRVAILWHEQWHEALEEASRFFFGDVRCLPYSFALLSCAFFFCCSLFVCECNVGIDVWLSGIPRVCVCVCVVLSGVFCFVWYVEHMLMLVCVLY